MLLVSLRHLHRHEEAEATLARYASAHPYYPMEAVVTGAIAWSEGDWMAVLLAYVDALNKEPQLVDLWPRLEMAATRRAEIGCLDDHRQQQQLQGLIERLLGMDLPDEAWQRWRRSWPWCPSIPNGRRRDAWGWNRLDS